MPRAHVNAITLGTLVDILSASHRVPAARRPAMLGRMRNFQKAGFPEMVSAGTGQRAKYWPEHVAQVLVAFELLRFRIPQTPAAIAVARGAGAVATTFAAAAAGGAARLRLVSNGLLEDAKRPGWRDLDLVDSTEEREPSGRGSLLMVDAAFLAEGAAAASQATDEPFPVVFFAHWRPEGRACT